MIAKNLISEIIPAAKIDDKIPAILSWMDIFKVSHLPVVDDNNYLGLISDSQIFDTNTDKLSVNRYKQLFKKIFVKEYQHIFEIIEVITKHKLSTIAVLKNDNTYLGVIRFVDLAHEFFKLMAIENIGGVITLELNSYDYLMSEISQIVESNDAKILSHYVKTMRDNNKLEITLKINRTDLSAIIQTFERYNYNIKSIYGDNQEVNSLLKNRMDMLLKYLDI